MASDPASVRYRVSEVADLRGRVWVATFSENVYQLYLYALTSHQLADPLTKHTGIKNALEGLTRASLVSFQTLDIEDFKLLQRLCYLLTHQSLYSQQMKTIQIVHLPMPHPLALVCLPEESPLELTGKG